MRLLELVNKKLRDACKAGDLVSIKEALAEGADINHDQGTPLLWACFWKHIDIVEFLLSMGADPRVRNDDIMVYAYSLNGLANYGEEGNRKLVHLIYHHAKKLGNPFKIDEIKDPLNILIKNTKLNRVLYPDYIPHNGFLVIA
jgi:ankyrin repeat protein